MRILSLRFQNLNSLAGEWSIDFTEPAYIDDGIFAITGPTGAGKTTILDAICLALYGRTPRLARISDSTNELMTRQSGECFAEVTFESAAGRFRCHWSQHRARRKPGGRLQPPRHEISDADSGKVLEAKIRNVAARIEQATGMDFDRFTRSMMLAQGGFAAFLQAAPDERAPILEQITGTEIYSDISKAVHERHAAEKAKLDRLEAALGQIRLLDGDALAALKQTLAEKAEAAQGLELARATTQAAIDWLDGIARLEQELRDAAAALGDWGRRNDAATDDRARLDAALRALALEGRYAALEGLRREQRDDEATRRRLVAELPDWEARSGQAAQAEKEAGAALAARQEKQARLIPVLRQARELDLQIGAAEAALADAEKALAQQRAQWEEMVAAHKAGGERLQEVLQALEAVEQSLGRSAADEALGEVLADWRSRAEALQRQHDELAGLESLLEVQRSEQDALNKKVADAEVQATAAREERQRAEADAQRLQRALDTLLDGDDIGVWRDRLQRVTDEVDSAGRLVAEIEVLTKAQARREAAARQQQEIGEALAEIENEKRREQMREVAARREVELLEKNHLQAQRIRSLEAQRRQLVAGEPCPLCGALEHPWADEGEPALDDAEVELRQAKEALDRITRAIAALEVRRAELESERRHQQQIAAEAQADIDAHGRSIAALAAALDLQADGVTAAAQAETERRGRLVQIRTVVAEAEALAASLDRQRQAVATARETETEAERRRHQADADAGLARERRKQLEAQMVDARRSRDEALARLQQEIGAHGVEVTPETLDAVLDRLTRRYQQWQENRRRQQRLVGERTELEATLGEQKKQIELAETALQTAGAGVERQRQEIEGLRRQRQALSVEDDPLAQEQRLTDAVRMATEALEQARQAKAEVERQLDQRRQRLETLEKDLADRAARIEAEEAGFVEAVVKAGFDDEAAFVAARLPEAERNALSARIAALDEEKVRLEATCETLRQQLDQQRRKALADRGREALAAELAETKTQLDALQREIGALQEQLQQQETLAAQRRDQLERIEAQRRECRRWDLLHGLIGSADGKKYRNFAQGLTFEIMIGHANRQLQKMTDRYLLVHDEARPLELNVIDNYQAGENRSTRNLSGGESFIVSLSLALGLSQMASRNVRVDSLFLDEGFGTLDEEALETALSTLAALHQEGKLIGVISHVGALKERIPTQIEVVPAAGGHSVIRGPGCLGRP